MVRFSVSRMLVCVTAFAIAYARFADDTLLGTWVPIIVGGSVGTLCLVVAPNEIWPTTRTALFTIAGAVCVPIVVSAAFPVSHVRFDWTSIWIGVSVGFLAGCWITKSNADKLCRQRLESRSGG